MDSDRLAGLGGGLLGAALDPNNPAFRRNPVTPQAAASSSAAPFTPPPPSFPSAIPEESMLEPQAERKAEPPYMEREGGNGPPAASSGMLGNLTSMLRQ